MKEVSLDYNKCARCGLCANICPEVFGWSAKASEPVLKNGSKKIKGISTVEVDKATVDEAAKFCPVGAIGVSKKAKNKK
jgi:ferredoxin